MLPFEVLAVFFLTSLSTAIPQNAPLANATSGDSSTTVDPFVHVESSATGLGNPSVAPVPVVGVSVTGLGDAPSTGPAVVTTKTPSIISIQTQIQPQVTTAISTAVQTYHPNTETTGELGSEISVAPAQTSAPISTSDLLNQIISGLYVPASKNNDNPAGTENTAAYTSPQVAQPTLSLSDAITIGSATLTLTPGLSTILGTSGRSTLIALTTDAAEQTIIVISSSGTAISATVTQAPVTLTAVATGLEATATGAARPGELVNPSSGGAATTTARKGAAVQSLQDTRWGLGVIGGLFGALFLV